MQLDGDLLRRLEDLEVDYVSAEISTVRVDLVDRVSLLHDAGQFLRRRRDVLRSPRVPP